MKKRRTLFLLIALTLSMVVGTFSVNADDKTPENEFRVGMETAYAPFNWTQTSDAHGAVLKNGEKNSYAGGYDVEIAKRVAEGLG